MIFFSLACVGYFFLFTGDTVLVRGPFPQIDQFASHRAERPECVPVPRRFFFTYRTPDHCLLHSLLFPSSVFRLPIYFNTYAIGTSIHPCTEGMGAARYTDRIEAVSSIS